jgi:hypothetical protein
MRRKDRSPARTDLLWTVVGFCLLQVALATYVERGPTRVRDDEFAAKLDRLRARMAEAPGKPLLVVLGSSRAQMGFAVGDLPGNGSDYVAFNFGFDGCGVMMGRVAFRRLSDAAIRPDVAVVEVVPVQLAVNGGSPVEDCWLRGARFRADEVAGLCPYSDAPLRLIGGWLRGRAIPVAEHHAQLRAELPLDRGPDGGVVDDNRPIDEWGWKPVLGEPTPERVAAAWGRARDEYSRYLHDGRLAATKLAALRDLLADCRRERIRTAIVLMPEGTAFRGLYPANMAGEVLSALEAIRDETDCAALIDARTWVADDGFADAHHLIVPGARAFTDRFGRESLPALVSDRAAACRFGRLSDRPR